jgi:hypothetical protein
MVQALGGARFDGVHPGDGWLGPFNPRRLLQKLELLLGVRNLGAELFNAANQQQTYNRPFLAPIMRPAPLKIECLILSNRFSKTLMLALANKGKKPC